MVYIYPGGILAALIQGEPLLSFLMAGPQLYTSLAAWYLVFYCPFDLFFKLFKGLRLQAIALVLQDWQRIGKCSVYYRYVSSSCFFSEGRSLYLL